MSGSSRLPNATNNRRPARANMRPPPSRAASVMNSRYNSAIASSPISSTTGPYRHATVSPSSHRAKRARDQHEETNNEMNINVVVRCRGRSEREIKENSGVVVSTPGGLKGTEVELSMGPLALSNKTYTFDRAFGAEADQSQIYDNVVEPLLEEMLSGYNCTIFAYGQTGTGKTYTMTGDMTDTFGTYSDFAGIIPRTLYNLFKQLGADNADNSVKCSFVELYNEELRDLLAGDSPTNLKIFDDSTRKGGVILQGMEETFIKSAAEGLKLLQEGSHKRQVAATKCNDLSSRSHTVFTITVHAKYVSEDGEDMLRTGKLNLVDLAGSENIGRSGAENKRAREAGMINQSLLTLGRVINALVDKSAHIPYRESKLTRLLQDSLGGRTKTCIIATISPAKSNLEETMSTLDYAARAKNIRNKPQVNQMLTKKTMLREYVTEIERLKADLKAARTKHGVFLTQETFDEMSEQSESRRIILEEHERKIELLELQIKKKNEQFENSMKMLIDTQDKLETIEKLLAETRESLDLTESSLIDTKKSLEEESVIRKSHQRTEDELSRAGNKLISTVGTTVADVKALHDKIGRMSQLEMVNYTKFEGTRTVVTDFADRIARDENGFAEAQEDLTNQLNERIQEFLKSSTQTLEESNAQNERFWTSFVDRSEKLEQHADHSKDEMNKILEEIKVVRDLAKERIGEGLRGLNDAAQRMAAGVVEDLGKFGAELNVSYARIRKDIEETLAANRTHMDTQQEQMDLIREDMKEISSVAQSSAKSAREQLDTILAEERQKAASERQDLILQITALINNSGDKQEARIEERVASVREELRVSEETVTKAVADYEEDIENLRSSEQKHLEELEVSETRIYTTIQEDSDAVNTHFDAIRATADAANADTLALLQSQTVHVDVQLRALDDFVTRARLENGKHFETFIDTFQDIVTASDESHSALRRNIASLQGNLETISTETVSPIAQLREHPAAHAEQTREALASLRSATESIDLAQYVPTGTTPRKRKFEYPTELPHTAPHEELLAKHYGLPTPRKPLCEKGHNTTSPVKRIPSFDAADLKADAIAGVGSAFYPKVNTPLELEPPVKKTRSSTRSKKRGWDDRENVTEPLGYTLRRSRRRTP